MIAINFSIFIFINNAFLLHSTIDLLLWKQRSLSKRLNLITVSKNQVGLKCLLHCSFTYQYHCYTILHQAMYPLCRPSNIFLGLGMLCILTRVCVASFIVIIDFLSYGRYQAGNLPNYKRVEAPKPIINRQSKYMPEISDISACPVDCLPNEEWQRELLYAFSELRQVSLSFILVINIDPFRIHYA